MFCLSNEKRMSVTVQNEGFYFVSPELKEGDFFKPQSFFLNDRSLQSCEWESHGGGSRAVNDKLVVFNTVLNTATEA